MFPVKNTVLTIDHAVSQSKIMNGCWLNVLGLSDNSFMIIHSQPVHTYQTNLIY